MTICDFIIGVKEVWISFGNCGRKERGVGEGVSPGSCCSESVEVPTILLVPQ